MKKGIKQMGVWFKERVKTRRKNNLENIYELIHQEFNYDRMNVEKAWMSLERERSWNAELLFAKESLEEENKKLKKTNQELKDKINTQAEYLKKIVEIIANGDKEVKNLKAEIKEMQNGAWKVMELKPGRKPKTQEMKIISKAKTSRIAKQMKEV